MGTSRCPAAHRGLASTAPGTPWPCRASREALAGPGWRHAVIVENSAGCIELVPFQAERPARAWMQSRVRGTGGQLRASRTGAACRASREEEVLAWLIRAAYHGRPWDLPGQVVWTSHLRAELYRVMQAHGRGAGPQDPEGLLTWRIRGSFLYWLAFAPGWAVDDIGWPDARHARRYYSRLAMTPVSEARALRAAQALARADTEAAARAGAGMPGAVLAAEAAARLLVPGRRRQDAEQKSQPGRPAVRWRGLQQPPQRQARQEGPEPR